MLVAGLGVGAHPSEPTEFEGRILTATITGPRAVAELTVDTAAGHLHSTGTRARITIPTATGDIA